MQIESRLFQFTAAPRRDCGLFLMFLRDAFVAQGFTRVHFSMAHAELMTWVCAWAKRFWFFHFGTPKTKSLITVTFFAQGQRIRS
jgi:hypothetical protein